MGDTLLARFQAYVADVQGGAMRIDSSLDASLKHVAFRKSADSETQRFTNCLQESKPEDEVSSP